MRTRMLILTAFFAVLTAVGAFIRIPTPVSNFSLQMLFTCMAGLLLGPKWGAVSQVTFTPDFLASRSRATLSLQETWHT